MSDRPDNIRINYNLEKMPNGEFVEDVYYLTHSVIKELGCEPDNEQFCSAEDTIRDYVWKSCQRAALQSDSELVEALEMVLDSDMAMREEDDGRTSKVLNACRAAIAKHKKDPL